MQTAQPVAGSISPEKLEQNYRGRFAPSPTGPLHFGSLVAALGSYLDAKHHNGIWLVRIEDLDVPRCIPGAADDILHTLEAYGLLWDEEVIYQSQRTTTYQTAFEQLLPYRYPCACSRKEIADSFLQAGDELIYPGTCRAGLPPDKTARAWRIRTDLSPHIRTEGGSINFNDALQGSLTQHLETEVGDFVILRADGLFSYQLAVVVDDAFQHITHIVRGCDLLTSTPRQIYLQQLLSLTTPAYMHLPIAVNAQGEKLSKQTLASAVRTDNVASTLITALSFLQQHPPAELQFNTVKEILNWAIANWCPLQLKGHQEIKHP